MTKLSYLLHTKSIKNLNINNDLKYQIKYLMLTKFVLIYKQKQEWSSLNLKRVISMEL